MLYLKNWGHERITFISKPPRPTAKDGPSTERHRPGRITPHLSAYTPYLYGQRVSSTGDSSRVWPGTASSDREALAHRVCPTCWRRRGLLTTRMITLVCIAPQSNQSGWGGRRAHFQPHPSSGCNRWSRYLLCELFSLWLAGWVGQNTRTEWCPNMVEVPWLPPPIPSIL